MKKLIFFLILSTVFFTGYTQTASRLLSGQANPFKQISPTNYLFVDTTPTGMYRIYAGNIDSFKLKPWNIKWLNDTIISVGNGRYVQLTVPYSNPTFVNTLSAGKVFGLSNVAITGNYSDLSGSPNLALYYLASNPSGYISDVTFGDVVSALGYIPLATEVDGSTTNEIQTLSGLNRTVNLSLGGSYTIPQTTWDSILNKPIVKRVETYSGTTDATGTYTITFSSVFPVAPNIQASIANQSATNQFLRVSSITTTGCVINVFARASLNLLGLDLIASATTNVNGASVDVLVTAK